MPASRHLQELVVESARIIGRSVEDVRPFLKILEENWYDTVESVRTISVADLQHLGVPLRFARELVALAQGNVPPPPAAPAAPAAPTAPTAPAAPGAPGASTAPAPHAVHAPQPAPPPPVPPAPPARSAGSGRPGSNPGGPRQTPAVVPPRKVNQPCPAQSAQPAQPAQPPQPPQAPPARAAQPKSKGEDESKGDQKGDWSNWRHERNEQHDRNNWERRERGKGSSSNHWNAWQSHPKAKGNTSNSKGRQEKDWDWSNANSKHGSASWYKPGGEHYHSDKNHNAKGKGKGANAQGPAKNASKTFTHKIFIDIEDPDPRFNLNGRLMGQNNQNVKHIREITGATVNLSGRGSPDQASANENLHVVLQSHDQRTLEEAVQITNDLIDTVLEQYANFHAEKGTEEANSSKGSGKAGKNRGNFARRFPNQHKNHGHGHFEEPAPKRNRGH